MKYPNRLHSLRTSRGLAQSDISSAIGIAQPEYSKMERGDRKIGSHINKLCDFFKLETDEICSTKFDPNHYIEQTKNKFKEDLPLFGMPRLNGEGIQIQKQFVSHTVRPDYLYNVNDSYSCFMNGEEMLPRYNHGELLYINPDLKAEVGDYVLVHINVDNIVVGIFRKVFEISDRQFKLQTLNPAKTETFKNTEIVAIHSIVGTRSKF